MVRTKYDSLVFSISLLTIVTSGNVHAAGAGSNPNAKPFIALQGQIIEVQGKLSSMQDQIDAIVARVDDIEGRVSADEAAIVSLQN
jgi:hypothetical protein